MLGYNFVMRVCNYQAILKGYKVKYIFCYHNFPNIFSFIFKGIFDLPILATLHNHPAIAGWVRVRTRRSPEHPLGHKIITNHLPGLLMAPRKASTKKRLQNLGQYALKVIFGFLILCFQLFWLIINCINCLESLQCVPFVN